MEATTVTITTQGAWVIAITIGVIGLLLLIQCNNIETKLIDKLPDSAFDE